MYHFRHNTPLKLAKCHPENQMSTTILVFPKYPQKSIWWEGLWCWCACLVLDSPALAPSLVPAIQTSYSTLDCVVILSSPLQWSDTQLVSYNGQTSPSLCWGPEGTYFVSWSDNSMLDHVVIVVVVVMWTWCPPSIPAERKVELGVREKHTGAL